MKIALKAVNGKYVCCELNGQLFANRDNIGEWEIFDLLGGPVSYYLKAHNGKYVCAENGGGCVVVANRNDPGVWESFGKILSSDKAIFQTLNGHYLCADLGKGGLIVADRGAIGPWERFNLIEISDTVQPVPKPSNGYNVKVGDSLSSKPLVRGAATANRAYFGEYADKRSDGGPIYKKHDRRAHLWHTDGNSWGVARLISDVESIHAIVSGDNTVDYATEHNAKVRSIDDNDNQGLQYDFRSSRGLCIGGGNCKQYGKLIACSHFNGNAEIAGYRGAPWKQLYTVADLFVWALTDYKGSLLAGCSHNMAFYHSHAGSILQLEPQRKLIHDPPFGYCKGFAKKHGVLYAMFGGHLAWTEDLIGWPSVEMPGNACWSMISGKKDTLIGVWYTDYRASLATGKPQGIWLVEFNVADKSVNIIRHWQSLGMSAPYFTGGGVVRLGGKGVGFITIGGRSRPLTVAW